MLLHPENFRPSGGEKQICFEGTSTISNAIIDDYLSEIINLLDRIILTANQVIKLDRKEKIVDYKENPKLFKNSSTE